MIGQCISHYRILERIGAGGMGEVYRAHDDRLQRDVAIKILPADSLANVGPRNNLLREARSASALNDPHICTIYEVGEVNGQAFIVMELIEGRSLKELIPSGGLPPGLVGRYGTQIASALAHAHDHNIIHRDVKTANVVITPSGQAKVLDFGLAKRPKGNEIAEATLSMPTVTQPGTVTGTLAYMAPEVLRGEEADARSDVWALGVALYEMATGRLPFSGKTGYELSAAILRESPAPLPSQIPAGLRLVIDRCLEKESGHRYQRAGEVRAVLEAAQFETSTSSTTSTGVVLTRVPKQAWYSRTRIAWTAGLLTAVAAGVLIAFSVGSHSRSPAKHGAQLQSLAVLPLENLSGDPSQQYFADGMTDELITDLAQISGLRVISRTSAMQYKQTKKPLPQIGTELNVEGLVEGTVERVGDRVRIRAQLIEASTDRHVWAKSYERSLSDILAMQDEVARTIAGEIQVALTPQEQARLTSVRAVNPEAHDALIQGLFYENQGETQKAFDSLRQATALAPDYAAAHAALAQFYIELGNISFMPPGEARAKAKTEALRALELDESLAEAHEGLAELHHYYDWDFTSAEREYKRALELKPGDAQLLTKYAFFLCRTGKYDDAVAEAKRAQDLDPLSLPIRTSLGVVLHYSRRYDEALNQYRQVIELDTKDTTEARFQIARLYITKRMFPEAFAEIKRMQGSDPSDVNVTSLLGIAYGFEGKREEAGRILNGLKDKRRREYVRPYILAENYAALGEKDQALKWLQKAYDERDDWVVWIKVDPNLDGLRADPRFAELLDRVGLKQ
jgi:eukaryotic-like serine/threonine-protein kinase